MGTFSNISLTVNNACGENLLNPTDKDIINGIGRNTFDNFCKNGFIYSNSHYSDSEHDADGKVNYPLLMPSASKQGLESRNAE